jgi:hypothetical protein
LGKAQEGLRLVALCYLIEASIGHGDTQKDFGVLAGMASELNYTEEQIDSILKEVAELYQKDRGKGLIEAAFGKDRQDQTAS